MFAILRIVSTMQDIVQAVTSLFECAKHENNDMTSTINDLREETWLKNWFKGRYFNFTEKSWEVKRRVW